MLGEEFGVSERRACKVIDQSRSTQRLPAPSPDAAEEEIRAFLREFAKRHPRWGWRRGLDALRDAGWRVNHKRVQRLWREEGLKVPYRKKKKRLTGVGVVVGAMRPIAPNVIWAMDFQFDQTSDLRTVKLLNIIDEFTRECLTIDVGRSITADDVVTGWTNWPASEARRATCAWTTGPSSWPTRSSTGAASTGRDRSSLTPVHPGRTAGLNRSTPVCATSS